MGLAVLRTPLISFMFENGKFTHENTIVTGDVLYYYCIGLFAYSAIHVLSRAFYSLQDTMTPVFVGIVAIGANIGLSLLLIRPMEQNGLALAYSLAGIINMVALLVLLRKKIGPLDGWHMIASFLQTLIASAVMGVASYYTVQASSLIWSIDTKLGQLIQLSSGFVVGVIVFSVIAILFHMEEAEMVYDILLRKLRRKH